jgi:hypothetical protein
MDDEEPTDEELADIESRYVDYRVDGFREGDEW